MRERSRDKNRLEHMLQAIERICRYTKGKNFEDFIADDMMYYAVVYFQVDNNVVWDVITNDLPVLEQQIKEYLTEEK